jgi:hypothetical protein
LQTVLRLSDSDLSNGDKTGMITVEEVAITIGEVVDSTIEAVVKEAGILGVVNMGIVAAAGHVDTLEAPRIVGHAVAALTAVRAATQEVHLVMTVTVEVEVWSRENTPESAR